MSRFSFFKVASLLSLLWLPSFSSNEEYFPPPSVIEDVFYVKSYKEMWKASRCDFEASRANLEQDDKLLSLIQKHRETLGLLSFRMSSGLSRKARLYLCYFSHYAPSIVKPYGGSVFDVPSVQHTPFNWYATQAYPTIGLEEGAFIDRHEASWFYAQSVEHLFDAWMNSPPHRAVIEERFRLCAGIATSNYQNEFNDLLPPILGRVQGIFITVTCG